MLSGGGAKGVMYVGLFKELTRQNVLARVETVHGASVGSLFAITIALGIPLKSLDEFISMDSATFKLLQGTKTRDFTNWMSLLVGTWGAEGRMRHLRRLLHTTILDFLIKRSDLTTDLRLLRDNLVNDSKFFPEYPITFLHLRLLHEYAPWRFKKLSIWSSNLNKGNVTGVVFSTQENSGVEVAWALDASVTVPGYMQASRLDGWEGVFVDGGLFSNYPVTNIPVGDEDRSMIVVFDEDAKMTTKLMKTSGPKVAKEVGLWRPAENVLLGTLFDISKWDWQASMNNSLVLLRDRFRNQVLPLQSKGITTLDFHKMESLGPLMQLRGIMQTQEFLIRKKVLPETNALDYRLFCQRLYEKLNGANENSLEFRLQRKFLFDFVQTMYSSSKFTKNGHLSHRDFVEEFMKVFHPKVSNKNKGLISKSVKEVLNSDTRFAKLAFDIRV